MLPIPIRIEKDALPTDLVNRVKELNGAKPAPFTFALLTAWIVIFGSIGLAQWIDTWWATLLAIFIVATRMNILGLLVHDQTHMAGYRHKFGDLIVNLFCAYPLLVLTVEGYAQVHLAHHRDYFSKNDPDHLRKSGPDWSFPKTRLQLLKLALKDLSGLNVIATIRGKRIAGGLVTFQRRGVNPKWVRPVYLLAIIGILVATGTWKLALLYWLLPLLTVMQLIVRWGALCEHEYNHENGFVTDTTPLIELRWWEKLILPNLNFSLHIYHHYFPGLAFSELPKVHQMFRDAGLVDDGAVFHGYGAYLKHLTTASA
ncbi:fatty acid desaturase [Zoogloea sp. LCSB751]|uniref:fatty acid desaturase family protein n=1 Tax=Zoogloea sp. LCSB751 TaxID=1965277 RepID=UPI001C1F7776|nr:fatty acid desaturase [Zoogloea sp. LCSB751]